MTANVRQAKTVASRWVDQEGPRLPGFRGAYFAGSIGSLADDAPLPPWSDVDVMVVLDRDPLAKIGKMIHEGVLLEITFLTQGEFRSAGAILGRYHLAHSFANANIIADPSGELTSLQRVVAREFAKRRWVEARCLDARTKVEVGLTSLPTSMALHDQVLTWVFPTGVLTQILLVAGLRNPTVRRRYEETLHLLTTYARLDLHDALLAVLGCVGMTRERVEHHVRAVTEVFDAAATVTDAPFPFASDISALARPIAIDGSRDMIARGLHREALFWLVVTYSRSLKMLEFAGRLDPESRFRDGYRLLLADLGINSTRDLLHRRDLALDLLPEVWHVAQGIIVANPEIEG